MRGRSLSIAVSLLVLVFLTVPASAQDGGDAVKLKDGKWLIDKYGDSDPTREEMEDGKILVLREEYDKLYYRFRSTAGTQRVPMSEVEKVLYFKRDPDYERGVKEMNTGQWKQALGSFEQALKSRVNWVHQYALWNMVLINEGGSAQEAIAAINRLTKRFPKTKFLIQAREKAGMIYLRANDVAGARREFQKIRSIPDIDQEIAAGVDYHLIFIEERTARNKGEIDRVKGKYETLLGEVTGRHKSVETKCRQGIGRCLVALGKHAEALAYFERITKESSDDVALAGAYLGIGEAFFEMGKWVEARRAFLRVCVLYEDSPGHAQALFRAGSCFRLARDTDYKNRARQEFQTCINKYPGSHWAKQSADALAQMK